MPFPLRRLLEDTSVNEVLINPGLVWAEFAGGRPGPVDTVLDALQISGIITNLANISNKEVDLHEGKGHLIVSAHLPGFRIEAQLPPVAVDGPYITLRRIPVSALHLADYVASGHLPQWVADKLRDAVQARSNILVSGGTSTGKTSFLNALLREVDMREILHLIETVPELVVSHPFIRRFEADEEQGCSVARLLKSALRSRPDRILIGEVRGGEAFDLADSANSGHRGSMASLHANSTLDALDRFENLMLEGRPMLPLTAIKSRIAKSFDLLVHMERRLIAGRYVRRISEVIELVAYDPAAQTYITRTVFNQESK